MKWKIMNEGIDQQIEDLIFSRKDIDSHMSGARVASAQPTFGCFMLRGLPRVSDWTAKGSRSTYGSRASHLPTSIPRPSASNCIRSLWVTDIMVPFLERQVVQPP